jgi:hypothetical protein
MGWTGQVGQALKTLAGFAVGKPVPVKETFPLRKEGGRP